MAANKFVLLLVTFSALSFTATRPVCADDVDCSIKVREYHSNNHMNGVHVELLTVDPY